MLEDGEALAGRRVLPPGWRNLAGQPDSEPPGFGRPVPGVPWGYGYQWWVLPHGPTGIHIGPLLAIGVFGQYIYVYPGARIVAVIQRAWREPDDNPPPSRPSRCSGLRYSPSDLIRRRGRIVIVQNDGQRPADVCAEAHQRLGVRPRMWSKPCLMAAKRASIIGSNSRSVKI